MLQGEAAQAGMSSLPVIKHFNIFAEVRSGLLPYTILPMMNQFKKLSIGALS